MLNIEKYKDEILSKKEKLSIGCASAEIAGICCDVLKCPECRKKTMEWLTSEYKESILTDEEKACLKKIIKSKRDSVIYISKIAFLKGTENEFTNIVIATKGTLEAVATPSIPFEGMELEREYSLEELGL